VAFPQLHMRFGGFAAVRVNDWSPLDYYRWRLNIESLRMEPFVQPRTFMGAWKEHVRFRHGNGWLYRTLRSLRQRAQ
jgi:hypothetical protein